ncbi:MAG: helix-turn-helix domain-containing protein [bacterium]
MRVPTPIPRQVLSDRLAALVDQGLLRRVAYQVPGQHQRSEYRLTDAGLALYPVLLALIDWGDAYLPVTEGRPLAVEHRGCGAEVRLEVRCADGHVLAPRVMAMRPGPGARRRSATGSSSS